MIDRGKSATRRPTSTAAPHTCATVDGVKRFCDKCRAVRKFEQPPCQEGHGSDCDEWCCTVCGQAMLIASFVVHLTQVRRTRASRAKRRRAA